MRRSPTGVHRWIWFFLCCWTSSRIIAKAQSPSTNGKLSVLPRDPPKSAYPLGLCVGHCDTDDQCAAGLYCFKRDPNTAVPGCDGGEEDNSRTDYCTLITANSQKPSTNGKLFVHPGRPPKSAYPLGDCVGHCNFDDNCAEGLYCFKRNPNAAVPGCDGGEEDNSRTDYCARIIKKPPKPSTNRKLSVLPRNAPRSAYPLGDCVGHCDTDDQCAEGLYCFKRGPNTAVPGCDGGEEDNSRTDYCTATTPETPIPSTNGKLSVLPRDPPKSAYPLGDCVGHCNSDHECAEGLYCFKRDPNTAVPGCDGGEEDNSRTDYCARIIGKPAKPSTDHKLSVLPRNAPRSAYPLGDCVGHCDTDDQCAEGLYCFKRGPNTAVPGCDGGEEDNSRTDYCTATTPETPIPSTVRGRTSFPESTVLSSNQSLERKEFVFSPNGKFKVGLTSAGDLVLQNKGSLTIWNAKISGGFRCYMQPDGNVIVRDSKNKALWTSHTYENPDARLVVDDGGYIAVNHAINGLVWLDGIPREEYTGPSSDELSFPVRGVFYYPWYPETWTVNGAQAKFEPDLGFYSSNDPLVAEAHIDAFKYAHVDLSIASWWGPESNLDRARLTMLMDKTIAMESPVKWTIYYEDERDLTPAATVLKADMDYLKKWFAWHPTWAHKNGKPVIFVYNEGPCDRVDRWMDGANGEWYVVMKLFKGYKQCKTQPDHWVSHACVRSPFLFSIRPSF
jgi:hypothetical protein